MLDECKTYLGVLERCKFASCSDYPSYKTNPFCLRPKAPHPTPLGGHFRTPRPHQSPINKGSIRVWLFCPPSEEVQGFTMPHRPAAGDWAPPQIKDAQTKTKTKPVSQLFGFFWCLLQIHRFCNLLAPAVAELPRPVSVLPLGPRHAVGSTRMPDPGNIGCVGWFVDGLHRCNK